MNKPYSIVANQITYIDSSKIVLSASIYYDIETLQEYTYLPSTGVFIEEVNAVTLQRQKMSEVEWVNN